MYSTENLDERGSTKPTSKHIAISEKILNGPLMSNENNESDRVGNDKVTKRLSSFDFALKTSKLKSNQTKTYKQKKHKNSQQIYVL